MFKIVSKKFLTYKRSREFIKKNKKMLVDNGSDYINTLKEFIENDEDLYDNDYVEMEVLINGNKYIINHGYPGDNMDGAIFDMNLNCLNCFNEGSDEIKTGNNDLDSFFEYYYGQVMDTDLIRDFTIDHEGLDWKQYHIKKIRKDMGYKDDEIKENDIFIIKWKKNLTKGRLKKFMNKNGGLSFFEDLKDYGNFELKDSGCVMIEIEIKSLTYIVIHGFYCGSIGAIFDKNLKFISEFTFDKRSEHTENNDVNLFLDYYYDNMASKDNLQEFIL